MPPPIDDWPHGRDLMRDSAGYALAPLAKLGTKICHGCGAEVASNAVLSVSSADHVRLLEKATGQSLGMAALVCGDCADLLRDALNERTDTMAHRLGHQVHHELNALYRAPTTFPKDGLWHE